MPRIIKVFASIAVLFGIVLGLSEVWFPDLISNDDIGKIIISLAVVLVGVYAFVELTKKAPESENDEE